MFDPVLIMNPNVLNLLRQDLQDAAQDLKSRGRLRQLFEAIRDEIVIPSIETNFRVGGRPRWEPLAPATYIRRGIGSAEATTLQLSGGLKPLDRTGQMKRAAIAKARFTIRNNEMTYGDWPARRWFAPVHDFGSRDGHIPQRAFAKFQPEDIEGIRELTFSWVEDAINKNLRHRYV